MLDIREMLRRTRAGESERAIARALSIGRPTVKKYRSWRVGRVRTDYALITLQGVTDYEKRNQWR